MWKFIKYCFLCMCAVISAAFGYNPPGLTLKIVIIGLLTTIVLIALLVCIIYLVSIIQKTK